MNKLVDLWPNFKIVHGKPRHSQSQGSVERANQYVKNMLTTWMQDHKTSHWNHGLKFIQLMKNSALHSGIKRSPYEAMFGCPPRHGLASLNIPIESLSNVESEEDLEAVFRQINVGGEHETEKIQLEEESPDVMEQDESPDVMEQVESLLLEQKSKLEDASHSLTDLDQLTLEIKRQRKEAFNCLTTQAKWMKRTSDQYLSLIHI